MMLNVILFVVGALALLFVALTLIFAAFLSHKRQKFAHIPSPPMARVNSCLHKLNFTVHLIEAELIHVDAQHILLALKNGLFDV